jgi:hypothetical protein
MRILHAVYANRARLGPRVIAALAPRACCSFVRTVSRRLLFTGSPLGAGLCAAGGADFEVLALLAFDAVLTADFAEATDDAEGLGGTTYGQ